MKLKTILASILLFLFSTPVFAGLCFPESQVYSHIAAQTEKHLPCGNMLNNPFGSLLNKFTSFPLSTTSFVKSGISYGLGVETCGGKDISNLQKLTFKNFSVPDKIKIIINISFFVIILILPLNLFFLIHHRIKSLVARIFFNIILIIIYVGWILYLLLSIGTCL